MTAAVKLAGILGGLVFALAAVGAFALVWMTPPSSVPPGQFNLIIGWGAVSAAVVATAVFLLGARMGRAR